MPVHQPKLEETKKYYTKKDFEDGKCDENGNPVIPGLATASAPPPEPEKVDDAPEEPVDDSENVEDDPKEEKE